MDCLFCQRPCQEQPHLLSGAPGAANCALLEGELQSFFILRKILDLGDSWLKVALLRGGGGAEDPNLMQSWFAVCPPCSEYVKRAWHLHQEIVRLQARFSKVKGLLKSAMKVEVAVAVTKTSSTSGVWSCSKTEEIRRAVCHFELATSPKLPSAPDLASESEPILVKAEPTDLHQFYDEQHDYPPEFDDGFDFDEHPLSFPSGTTTPGFEPPDSSPSQLKTRIAKKTAVQRKRASTTTPEKRSKANLSDAGANTTKSTSTSSKTPKPRKGRKKHMHSTPPKRSTLLRRLQTPPQSKTLKNSKKQTRIENDPSDPKIPPVKEEVSSPTPNLTSFDDLTESEPSTSLLEFEVDSQVTPNDPNSTSKKKRTSTVATGKKRVERRRHRETGELLPIDFYYCRYSGKLKQKKFAFCPYCKARVKRDDLKQHTELHRERKKKKFARRWAHLNCKICSYPAMSEDELQKHMEHRHPKEKKECAPPTKWFCPAIGCSFYNYYFQLKLHVSKSHPDLTEASLESHPEKLALYGEFLLRCPRCSVIFDSSRKYQGHVNNNGCEPSRFVCEECGASYKFSHGLVRHRSIKHPTAELPTPKFICEICSLDYTCKQQLQRHMENIHPEGKVSTDPEQIFKCRYCEMTSPFRPVVWRHEKTHLQSSGSGRFHKCHLCEKVYRSDMALKRHVRIHHPKVKVEVPCPHCQKIFPARDYMLTHAAHHCKARLQMKASSAGTSTTPRPELELQVGSASFPEQLSPS